VAKEMGEGLGRSKVLQRTVPRQPQSEGGSLMLRRKFESREEMITYLRAEFPAVGGEEVAELRGGRRVALALLEKVNPDRYARTRNYLDGQVSRLSPYIRHGVITLKEAREHALRVSKSPSRAYKFVYELAWREYWRRLFYEWGAGVWQDREEYKTGWRASDYRDELPPEVTESKTGLACMDSFARELRETGYLHNHARMWTAAYVVHWLRVKWQAGARWFLDHLLDADEASNNLSWQWVASTFSHRPYFFNRENLEKYTDGRYCRECPARAECPFDAPYAQLEQRLFPRMRG
jgi:deoxyribodipyrimidine photo-lyase